MHRRLPESLPITISGQGPPLLLIHGFLGNRQTWNAILPSLTGSARCIAVDLPGHGGTPVRNADALTLDGIIVGILNALDGAGIESTNVYGYSMGGRIALHLAHRHPERVATLMLEGANPGMDRDDERAARRDADDALADRIIVGGMAAFVRHWEAQPLFASQRALPPDTRKQLRETRLRTSPEAAASLLRNLSPGRLPSLWPELASIPSLRLAIAGEQDQRYAAIARRVGKTRPGVEIAIVAGAGHAVHLERPDGALQAIRRCLGKPLPD